ncbi:hypothetical protein BgiBS90_007595 [Biomphalaria glabrata]|nr:hypothetical protein BgiBS90_007595 [Biomphalaria glabrata]
MLIRRLAMTLYLTSAHLSQVTDPMMLLLKDRLLINETEQFIFRYRSPILIRTELEEIRQHQQAVKQWGREGVGTLKTKTESINRKTLSIKKINRTKTWETTSRFTDLSVLTSQGHLDHQVKQLLT